MISPTLSTMNPQPEHIGIASITAEGGALCYREIVHVSEAVLGSNKHPEITLHSFSFSRFVDSLETKEVDWAQLMIASSKKLAAAGAGFFVCPANTNHVAFDRCQNEVAVPWIHIADVVAEEASRRSCKRSLVLGTRTLVESSIYPNFFSRAGIEVVIPGHNDKDWLHGVIYNELIRGVVRRETKENIQRLIDRYMRNQGCDSVILGCTELPLVVNQDAIEAVVLDSTRILALGAVARSLGISLGDLYARLARSVT